MKKLYIIGIGTGNPEHVTMQAIKALNLVDVFFFMDKGDAKNDLVTLRKKICERYIEHRSYRILEVVDPVRDSTISDYKIRVQQWHEQRVLIYEDLIQHKLKENQCGAFLVWGDPSLYDSTLRIVDQVLARGKVSFGLEVIAGITSIQVLAASHKISLNGIGESIVVTTGRQLAAESLNDTESIIVMLDGQCSFRNISDKNWDIYWGAYLGMDEEVILSGKLAETASRIEELRGELRQRHEWIMDTYLLRRSNKKTQAEFTSDNASRKAIDSPL